MSFTSRINAVFETILPNNLPALFARDLKPALDALYPLVAAGVPLLDDSISRPIGTTVLHVDGFTVKPGEGDLFTIAGDSQVYEVISATALIGSDSDVTFRPGLKVAIPAADGNQAVTFTGLPDLRQRTYGRFIQLLFPLLTIEIQKNEDKQGEEYESRSITVLMMFATTDSDGPGVMRKTQKYARAIYAVIESASVSDLTTGASPNQIMPISKSLSWEYDELGKDAKNGLWTQPVNFRLVLTFSER